MSVQQFVYRYKVLIVLAVILFTPALTIFFKMIGIVLGSMNAVGVTFLVIGGLVYGAIRFFQSVNTESN